MYDVAKFGIYNEPEMSRPYEQYAIDRFDERLGPVGVEDHSAEDVMEGRFSEDVYNSFYL